MWEPAQALPRRREKGGGYFLHCGTNAASEPPTFLHRNVNAASALSHNTHYVKCKANLLRCGTSPRIFYAKCRLTSLRCGTPSPARARVATLSVLQRSFYGQVKKVTCCCTFVIDWGICTIHKDDVSNLNRG